MQITYINFLLGWNPLVMSKYGMVDYDIAEIVALEAVFPDINCICVTFTESNHGRGKH